MDSVEDIRGPRRFRGHHLICLRYFAGAGFDDTYRTRLAEMSSLLEIGSGEVTEGPDDLCLVCPDYSLDRHECVCPDCDEFCVRALDALACRLLGIRPGEGFTADELTPPARAALAEWVDGACATCDHAHTCAARGAAGMPN